MSINENKTSPAFKAKVAMAALIGDKIPMERRAEAFDTPSETARRLLPI